MSPEEKKLLEETAELSRENNKMLHQLHRSLVWGRIWHITYWVIIIGASIGAFYFIQPYIESLKSLYGQVQDTQSNIGSLIGF